VVVALAPAFALGADGLQPAIGKLGFTRNRLRLGADFGECAALIGDLALYGAEPGFEIGGGRQGGERGFRTATGGESLVAAGGNAESCFLQRRNPGGIAGD